MSWPVDSGGQVWFYGHVVQRTRAAEPAGEPARPRGQSNDVRPRDQSSGPWSGSPQSQLSGYIFGGRQDAVVF